MIYLKTPNLIHIQYKESSIAVDLLGSSSDNSLLFLHGAGQSSRQGFGDLRQNLYTRGISSCAFDFIGHGDTGGSLKESSLEDRTLQTCKVIEELNLPQSLSVVAASMSGYTAIKLLEIYDIERLILFVPAIYTRLAYKLPFNSQFSACTRKNRSWENSDVWSILAKYKGKLLIISAEKDNVIPREIIEQIYSSAVNSKTRKIVTIPNAPHKIISYLSNNKYYLEKIINEIMYLYD